MYRSNSCDVGYHQDLNVVLVTWKQFCCGDGYRKPLLHALDIMRAHKSCHYAADTRQGFENDPADTAWVFGHFLPQAAQTGCKHIFFIIGRDNALKEELDGQAQALQKHFAVHYCFGLDEVRAILELGRKTP